jgi:phosphatidylglycerol lysyltransferase
MLSPERTRAHAIVKERGWNGTSFQVLGEGYAYHFDGDAFVAYVDTGSAWVAAGAPVARRERLADVAESFRVAAARAGRSACFFGAGARFVEEAPTWETITIGAQPIWCTTRWSDHAKSARSISAQVRRARAKGVSIRRVDPKELADGSSTRRAMVSTSQPLRA